MEPGHTYLHCPCNPIITSMSPLLHITAMELPPSVFQLVRSTLHVHVVFIPVPLSPYAGTYDVIGIQFNTSFWTDISCVFNAGSYAIGCLVNLTNIANGISYFITVQRFPNVNIIVHKLSLCQSFNFTFGDGKYSVKVYDIAKDGNISTLPAVVEEILIKASTAMILDSSHSCM